MTICQLCEDDVYERKKLEFGDGHDMYLCKSCHRWMNKKLKNTKNIYRGPEK